MADCTRCVSEKLCRYNDGFNLYCKEDYECPHFVEIVRCRDCQSFISINGKNWCEEHSDGWGDNIICVNEDDFCSFGIRKESNK